MATGTYQKPKVPAAAEKLPEGILQLHAESYKNPGQAADGAVLLVGSGQTGCQIAEDFLRAGRQIYLSVGRSGRLPRRYRGKDCLEWQAEMGTLDRTPDMLDGPTDRFKGDPHVTGRDGGSSVSLYGLHRRGALLLGRLVSAYGDALSFDGSLASNIAYADRFASDLSASVDAHIDATAQSAPATEQDPGNADWPPDIPVPDIRTLSLKNAGIGSVIWATGFDYDFSWIEFPVLDEWGYPVARNGATRVPGLFFCGLNWMTWRKSGILYGVAEDALAVSERIAERSRQGCCACLGGGGLNARRRRCRRNIHRHRRKSQEAAASSFFTKSRPRRRRLNSRLLQDCPEILADGKLAPEGIERVAHGTTVGTNALIQRKCGKVAVVTSAGFKDLLEIGRQTRPNVYDIHSDHPPPLVERADRL